MLIFRNLLITGIVILVGLLTYDQFFDKSAKVRRTAEKAIVQEGDLIGPTIQMTAEVTLEPKNVMSGLWVMRVKINPSDRFETAVFVLEQNCSQDFRLPFRGDKILVKQSFFRASQFWDAPRGHPAVQSVYFYTAPCQ